MRRRFQSIHRQHVARGGGRAGVSQNVISSAFMGVVQDQAVLAFDRRQRGTFRKSFEEYVATRVGAGRIKRAVRRCCSGTRLCCRGSSGNSACRKSCSWRSGGWRPISALATWASCRSSASSPPWRTIAAGTDLFQRELLSALKILQRGDLSLSEMKGAYAGEIGQTQFLPSNYPPVCRRLRRQWPGRSGSQPGGCARLHGEPAERQRLEGRPAV
jgi:hypothetical protein